MWAGCCMPGIFVLIQQYFLISFERLNPGIHTFKESFRKAENKIPFEFWYGLWFLWPKLRLSSFMDFAQAQGALTVPPDAWLCKHPRDGCVTARFCYPSFRGGKAGAVSSGTDNSSQQKGKVPRYFPSMCFSSTGIILFPINSCSL